MIFEEGLEAGLGAARTARPGGLGRVRRLGAEGPLELNVADPGKRSHAVTSLRIGAPHGTRLRTWVEGQAGSRSASGLGMETEEDPKSDGFFRWATWAM
jgi:alanine-glyoxylate transaminase / serine-glyoxylate transaminase / serine-pyruvate transaminase